MSLAFKQVQSLADMQRFVMEHTDFQKVQGNVSKHVALMSELSEIIGKRNLMELSMVRNSTHTHTHAYGSGAWHGPHPHGMLECQVGSILGFTRCIDNP